VTTPTLTAAGRPYATTTKAAPRAVTVQEWDALVTRMLQFAVQYGELDARYAKRNAWCADNWDHPKIREREDETHATLLARNEVAATAMDLADAVSRLHAHLSPDLRSGLEALVGHALWPTVPQAWLMAAKETRSSDVAQIVFRATAIPNDKDGW
jgi:hypothetical protein